MSEDYVQISNYKDDLCQCFRGNELHSYTFVDGKKARNKYVELYIEYSPCFNCEMCGRLAGGRKIKFKCTYIPLKKRHEEYFSGNFCTKCIWQIEALKESVILLKNIKEEIKNEKQNSNGRATKRVFMLNDGRN